MKLYNSVGGRLLVRELEHPTDQLVPELVRALENLLFPVPTAEQLSREEISEILERAKDYLREETVES